MKRALITFCLLTALAFGAFADDPLDHARAALQEGSAQRAVEILEELHASTAPTPESQFVLAQALHIRLDEVSIFRKRSVASRMKAALHATLELDPAHIGAHEELSDFYYYAPRIVGGSATKAQEQIAALDAISAADALRVRAKHAFDDDPRTAESLLSQAIALQPRNAELWFQRGRARQKSLEKDAAALNDFDRALELGHDQIGIHYYIGRLTVRLRRDLDRGEQSLRRYLEGIGPDESRNRAFAHYRLAQIFEIRDQDAQARQHAELSLELEPELDEARGLLQRLQR